MSAVVGHASTERHELWDGPRRYVRVVIHPSLEHFRAAASAHSPHMEWEGAKGCFHPAPVREKYVDGKWIDTADPHWAGTLRLVRGHFDTEVVTHECVHAGAAIYRMDVMYDIRLGNGCREREESLAYIVGDIAASVNDELHRIGAWDK